MVLSVWKDLPKYWVTLLRSSFIGCWLGITPGGAIAASFMGYNLAKRFSKDPDSFGKGRIEGVFAPETAAHASGTAALLPMLALGIPGSGTAAILLGGLMVWGLNPGPLLFVEHKDFVWGLIASMYLGNVVGLVLVLTTVPIFASILRVPFAAVAPMIVVSCAIGAYAIQNAMFDIWLMLGFGVVGYVFKKIGIPLAPFTLALVLGNRAEDAFRLSMIGSGGDMKVFWSNGLVGSITTLAIVLLFWPAAILLGGLMVWGLNPGPLLFVEHKDFVWGSSIASMYLGNVVGLVMVLSTGPIFAAVLRVPFAAIAPMIVVSCAVASTRSETGCSISGLCSALA